MVIITFVLISFIFPLSSANPIVVPPFQPFNDSIYHKCFGPGCSPTLINGTIYLNSINNPISNADVEVICNGLMQNTTSDSLGQYAVTYYEGNCQYTDSVLVSAKKDSLTGETEGIVNISGQQVESIRMDVGIFNVALVPEFGILIGSLTIISSIVVFFFLRR